MCWGEAPGTPRSGWGVLHLLDCLQQGPQASWPLAIARPGFLIAPAQCSRAKCTLGLALRSAGEPKEGAPDPKGLRDCLTIPTPLPGGFQSVWKGYPSLFSLGWARVPVPQGKGLGWSCYVDELGGGGNRDVGSLHPGNLGPRRVTGQLVIIQATSCPRLPASHPPVGLGLG